MHRLPSRSVVLQGTLAVAALGLVALAPPPRGPMLLVPLAGDQGMAIRIATAHGARLIRPAAGGALLVWADRDMAAPLLGAGVLALAAPVSACGTAPA